MTERELAKRIAERIGEIPVNNTGYISPVMERLRTTLSAALIRKIAEVAAQVARADGERAADKEG